MTGMLRMKPAPNAKPSPRGKAKRGASPQKEMNNGKPQQKGFNQSITTGGSADFGQFDVGFVPASTQVRSRYHRIWPSTAARRFWML
jgi:hypothetical protein